MRFAPRTLSRCHERWTAIVLRQSTANPTVVSGAGRRASRPTLTEPESSARVRGPALLFRRVLRLLELLFERGELGVAAIVAGRLVPPPGSLAIESVNGTARRTSFCCILFVGNTPKRKSWAR